MDRILVTQITPDQLDQRIESAVTRALKNIHVIPFDCPAPQGRYLYLKDAARTVHRTAQAVKLWLKKGWLINYGGKGAYMQFDAEELNQALAVQHDAVGQDQLKKSIAEKREKLIRDGVLPSMNKAA